jgi:hypothetical protein
MGSNAHHTPRSAQPEGTVQLQSTDPELPITAIKRFVLAGTFLSLGANFPSQTSPIEEREDEFTSLRDK